MQTGGDLFRAFVCSDLKLNQNQCRAAGHNADETSTWYSGCAPTVLPHPSARTDGRTCTRRKEIWNGVIMERIHARRKAAVVHCSSRRVPRSASKHPSTPVYRGQLTQCTDHVRAFARTCPGQEFVASRHADNRFIQVVYLDASSGRFGSAIQAN